MLGVRPRHLPKARDPPLCKRDKDRGSNSQFTRSRDLVAASRGLFVKFRDLLVIFDPTSGINVNDHLLLPINSPPWGGGEDFWPFALLLTWLALLLTMSL